MGRLRPQPFREVKRRLSMESPGHWIHASPTGEISIGSLTGNVFRWFPGWLAKGAGSDEALRPVNVP